MPKTFPVPQAFSDKPRHPIALKPVKSSQVSHIGYDEATKTLAVQFSRGTGAIYHYPGVTKEHHAAFVNAESIGVHFGKHIKSLPFNKFAAEKSEA